MWLVNTAPTFTVDFGSASVGSVTVDITRSDGTALITAGVTTDNTDGTYDYSLSVANNDQLDRLKLDWTVASTSEVLTTYEEIVGSLLFTIDEARNKTITGLQTPLSSSASYSDTAVSDARRRITEQFEQRTGRSWIRRYCRVEVPGSGDRYLSLWDGHARDADGNELAGDGRFRNVASVMSATVNGTTVSTSNIVVDGSYLVLKSGVWSSSTIANPFNVTVEYEYGFKPVPAEANDAGLRVALATLVASDVSDYASTFTNPDGTLSYPQGGLVYPSRVWEWLKQHPRPVMVA